MVLRICPTCIGLAMFGELKSMIIRSLLFCDPYAQAIVFEERRQSTSEIAAGQSKVEKPGARHFGAFANIAHLHRPSGLFGKVLRRNLRFLGKEHRHIALVIAELGIGGGDHLRDRFLGAFSPKPMRAVRQGSRAGRHQLRGERLSKNAKYLRGVVRPARLVSHRLVVEELCDGGQCPEVGFELIFRSNEEDDKENPVGHPSESSSMPTVERPNAATTSSTLSRKREGSQCRTQFLCSSSPHAALSSPTRVHVSSSRILPALTSTSTNSPIASHRAVVFISGTICSADKEICQGHLKPARLQIGQVMTSGIVCNLLRIASLKA